MGKKTLLLGAGFSYELGLPLASGVSEDLYHYLRPERLTVLFEKLRLNDPFGPERPINPSTFQEIEKIFLESRDAKVNYEELISTLEKNASTVPRSQSEKDTFHYFIRILVDTVSEIIWIHQEMKIDIYEKYKHLYRLIDQYLENEEVYVFTLNHDLCLEMICLDYGIPFSYGTHSDLSFLRTNVGPKELVTFTQQERKDVKSNNSAFYSGKTGFNIVKLHGAFNEFGFEDESNLLFIDPSNCRSARDYITKAKKIWHGTEHLINGKNARVSECIPVTNLQGEFQILTKSLMVGGTKYSITVNPKAGEEKMQLFEDILKSTEELTVIGYGFADRHINVRIYNSLVVNPTLKMKTIGPVAPKNLDQFEPFNYDLRLTSALCTTTEWLHYRVREKWDSDPSGEVKNFRNERSNYDEKFRKLFLR